MSSPSNPVQQAVDQSTLIPLLNQYLTKNGYSLEADDEGICHGLAVVQLKYEMEGRGNEFIQFLHLITKLGEWGEKGEPYQLDSATENAVNTFIQQVIFSFNPGAFDKNLSQADSLRLLKVQDRQSPTDEVAELFNTSEQNGTHVVNMNVAALAKTHSQDTLSEQTVLPPTTMSMNLYKQKWMKVFKQLAIENTAMLVGSPGHAASIFFKDGKYNVYDPNRKEIKQFDTVNSLMPHLGKVFSLPKEQNYWPLKIELTHHPKLQSSIDFKAIKTELLSNGLLTEQHCKLSGEIVETTDPVLSTASTISGATVDALLMSAMDHDNEALQIVLASEQISTLKREQPILFLSKLEGVIGTEIGKGQPDLLQVLLPELDQAIRNARVSDPSVSQHDKYSQLFKHAVKHGKSTLLTAIIRHSPESRDTLLAMIANKEEMQPLLKDAIKNGDHRTLDILLDHALKLEAVGIISKPDFLDQSLFDYATTIHQQDRKAKSTPTSPGSEQVSECMHALIKTNNILVSNGHKSAFQHQFKITTPASSPVESTAIPIQKVSLLQKFTDFLKSIFTKSNNAHKILDAENGDKYLEDKHKGFKDEAGFIKKMMEKIDKSSNMDDTQKLAAKKKLINYELSNADKRCCETVTQNNDKAHSIINVINGVISAIDDSPQLKQISDKIQSAHQNPSTDWVKVLQEVEKDIASADLKAIDEKNPSSEVFSFFKDRFRTAIAEKQASKAEPDLDANKDEVMSYQL